MKRCRASCSLATFLLPPLVEVQPGRDRREPGPDAHDAIEPILQRDVPDLRREDGLHLGRGGHVTLDAGDFAGFVSGIGVHDA